MATSTLTTEKYTMNPSTQRLQFLGRTLTIMVLLGWLHIPHLVHATPKLLSMYVGEVKVLKLEKIERVAIGNPTVASNSILPNGQLVLLADSPGITTMHIWFSSGKEQQFDVQVNERKNFDGYRKLSKLLSDMPGVSVSRVDDMLVVSGKVTPAEQELLLKVLKKYDALNLVALHEDDSVIRQMLQDVPNLTIRDVDDYTVVSGEVNEEYSAIIKRVAEKYPRLFDLTRVHKSVVEKMVYMRVRVMEVKKTVTEKLGIKWSNLKLVGPSASFGVEVSQNGGTLLNFDQTPDSLKKPDNVENLTTARGYFGIGTQLDSVLNISEVNGDAVMLAEPQLSTRSGGKATFLAGGEYPVPVVTGLGQTNVEYKQYGIRLNIEPMVDSMGNVLASVETEVSSIDASTEVQGIPGTLTRRTTTEVNLKAEQTLVIAGLVQDMVGKGYDKVKWLGDLPILGPLFRSKDFTNSRSELVILITPYVRDIGTPMSGEEQDWASRIEADFDELSKGSKLLD